MFVAPAPDSEASSRAYAEDMAARGYVMNLTRLWAWRPDVYEAFQALRTLLTKPSLLSQRELGVLVCGMAGGLGDAYCALAWGKKLADASDAATAAAVLEGKGASALSKREDALAGWARKVAADPNATVAADVETLRAAGLGDREIVEATLFVAFRVAFSTVNDALGARPDWQLAAAAPQCVQDAVSFGRKVAEPSPASA